MLAYALVLVEYGESGVLHELPIELLELLERILVVLTGTLCEDIHAEVGLGDFLFVCLLVRCRELVTLTLEFLL